jgi:hypothetical protein
MMADRTGDKKLNKEEFQAFLHPEVVSKITLRLNIISYTSRFSSNTVLHYVKT